VLNLFGHVVSRRRKGHGHLSAKSSASRKTHSLPIVHLQIARSLRYLEKNWHRPINVGDLFKAARMSRRGFVKAFTKHLGRSPSQQLEQLRMEHARQLILRPGHTLKQTASSCGYRSINSFLVAFRRFNGMNPTRYLRENKSRRMTVSNTTSSRRSRNLHRNSRRRFVNNIFFKASVRTQRR
jgi:transcriptional regulator GlxA family with amidase domain